MTATKELRTKVKAKTPANAPKAKAEEPQEEPTEGLPVRPDVKVIGGGRKPPARFDFGLVAYRNDVEEVHYFTARKIGQTQDALGLILGAEMGESELGILPRLAKLLRKAMVDDDGTPLDWDARDHLLTEADCDDTEEDFDADDPKFFAPDGTVHRLADRDTLDKLYAIEAGSSKARWMHLLEVDEAVDVELADLTAVAKEIISRTADRPSAP